MTRNTQGELLRMKEELMNKTLSKEMKCKEAASLLGMHPKSFSRLRKLYKRYGLQALIPDKPGPKAGAPPPNRTPTDVEEVVILLGRTNPFLGPVELSHKLEDEYSILLDQSTVWRILKRSGWRYNTDYTPIPKKEPALYCLDEPGEELQLDASYPFGRSRKIVCFSAIDDCSRYVLGQMAIGDTAANAIRLVDYILDRAPFTVKRIRVDNRYGKTLRDHCAKREIELIENDAYAPTQNGKIERYHRTLKARFFNSQANFADDLETLEYKLQLWLHYYNTKRKHTGLGMNRFTPQQKIATTLLYSLTSLADAQPQKVTLTLQSYNT